MATKTIEECFFDKIRQAGQCWLWTGATNTQGYGRFAFQGRNQRAHRVSWQLHRGPIPAGMFVCHTCDNPPCVNPAHLFLGTTDENMADMAHKGRSSRLAGERNPRVKLTSEQVAEIRRAREAGAPMARLAAQYGVSKSLIGQISLGQVWR